jgi:hypothetical protein
MPLAFPTFVVARSGGGADSQVTRRTASQVTAMVTNAAIFYLARPNATGFGYPPGVRIALTTHPSSASFEDVQARVVPVRVIM